MEIISQLIHPHDFLCCRIIMVEAFRKFTEERNGVRGVNLKIGPGTYFIAMDVCLVDTVQDNFMTTG